MEPRGNFDYKSDLDFPTLGSNIAASGDSRRNSSPPQQQTAKESFNKDYRENSRSMSRGRGKKQNWKTVQVEFNNNGHGQRYPPRGSSRPRFGNNHAIPRSTEEQPLENVYRSYRSRNRRARGGLSLHHLERPQSTDSVPQSPEHNSEQIPQIMAIPYTPNFAPYVQPLASAMPPAENPQAVIQAAIRRQVEYYFSKENLVTDMFMRTNMTREGFLSIQLIANFNKIRLMNVSLETIIQALEDSDKLEVVDREMVRPVIDPLRWPLTQPAAAAAAYENPVPAYENPVAAAYENPVAAAYENPVAAAYENPVPRFNPVVAPIPPLVENYQNVNPVEPSVEGAQATGIEIPSAVPQMPCPVAESTSPPSVEEITESLHRSSLEPISSYYFYDNPVRFQNVYGAQQELQDAISFRNPMASILT